MSSGQISVFMFHKGSTLRKECIRQVQGIDRFVVCSEHFTVDCSVILARNFGIRKRMKPKAGAFPSDCYFCRNK